VTTLDVSFLDWQKTVWQDPAKFKVVAAGRRTGKTELAAWRLLINALTDGITDQDAARFYVAPTQQQARKVMWGKLHQLGKDVIIKSHINNLEVTLINGQIISLQGADRPETMRGVKLADLVLDEYADMKPYVLEEILVPALSDYDVGYLMIGTPMGRNHFYDEFIKAQFTDDPDYAAFEYTTYDNPFINKKLLERRKKQMSTYAFNQEFMASFASQGSEIFQEEWIEYYDDHPAEGSWYVAIDLAGFEEVGKKNKTRNLDSSALVACMVDKDGNWWLEEIQHGRWTLDETARRIFDMVDKYRPIKVGIEKGIAKQAVMSPLSDEMRRRGRYFAVHDLTHGNQKKTDRVVWALQGRFENGMINIKKGAEWAEEFLDQLYQFPDRLTHDDMIDAFSYIDQLSDQGYLDGYEIDDFELFDDTAGW